MRSVTDLRSRSAALVASIAGLATCLALVVPAPAVASEPAASVPTVPNIADYIKNSREIADFNFDRATIGEGGTITDSDGNSAVIHGSVDSVKAADSTTGIRFGSKSWLTVTNTKTGKSPLAGLHDVTISYDSSTSHDESNQGWSVFAAPNGEAQQYPNEHYLGVLDTKSWVTVQKYNNFGGRNESPTVQAGGLSSGWKHVDIVIADAFSRLYINGKLIKTATPDSGRTLPEILGASGGILQVGKANWGSGEFFPGELDNLKIYDSSKAALVDPVLLNRIDASVPSVTTKDFTVPVDAEGHEIAWTSSDPSVISVDSATGAATVTRPTNGKDAAVTLTRTLDGATKTYTVKILHAYSDKEKAQMDADAVSVMQPQDVRANFVVPMLGKQGSTLSYGILPAGTAWASIEPGYEAANAKVAVKRPAAGKQNGKVTLRVTSKNGSATVTRDIPLTITAISADETAPSVYIWAFFTGEGTGGERISLAASKGNNALEWNTLNNGKPLFTSTLGEKGLRDPFIMKSRTGDTFYMLATDLKISGRKNCPAGQSSFAGSQVCGSKYLEIWQSNDLVHWSDQRHVKVSSDLAGNTWAPEAYWDDAIGKYVVYWASNLYDTADYVARKKLTYNHLMYATTSDFITFSKPKVWVDVNRNPRPANPTGSGSIDATVIKVGDTYYRVYKDEKTMTLRQERSNDLLATVTGSYPGMAGIDANHWETVATKIGYGADGYTGKFAGQGEGPSFFPSNPGDVNGYKYYLFVDQPSYHHSLNGAGGPNHYVPFATNDIADGKWVGLASKMPDKGAANQFPTLTDGGKPRHGTVIGVTRAQYQKVLEAFDPAIAVTSVDAMAATTTVGKDPTAQLPKSATYTTADGTKHTANVVWDPVASEAFAKAGTATVFGTLQDDSRMPVELMLTVKSDQPVDPGKPATPHQPENPSKPSSGKTPGNHMGGVANNSAAARKTAAHGLASTGTAVAAIATVASLLALSGLSLVILRRREE